MMIIQWLKDKIMSGKKPGSFFWFTNNEKDLRVNKDEAEAFSVANPEYQRGKMSTGPRKKKVVMEQPKEYNYEDDMAQLGQTPNWIETVAVNNSLMTMNKTDQITETVTVPANQQIGGNMFLVEGNVQMRPAPGSNRTPITADQRRIVMASNIDEAIQKYVNHFASLNTALETYIVVHAAASEAIS